MRRTLLPTLMLLAACSATPPDEAEPSASDEAVPSASMQLSTPLPSSAPDGKVLGWPDTNQNEAGVYSWDGARCAGSYCTLGFMHNGYGSGNVEIRIDALYGGAVPDDAANAVTVAGHDGVYKRTSPLREDWIVDIEGKVIAIHLTARPGTSEADLAEAHAIIDSMRTDAEDNQLGFRLVFTLTTNDWDSG